MKYNKNNEDILIYTKGLEFLDTFLDYQNSFADNRFYHFLKASNCKKFIEENASPDKIFLDAGAGRGPYTKLAQNKYKQIYCFEYDINELERAQKNLDDSNIIFKQVDITNIPLADNYVDVAVCSEVLEHIPDYNKAMLELYRVIKSGGKLLFSMPNNNSLLYAPSRFKNRKILKNLDESKQSNPKWEQMRHYYFSYKDIDNIATKAGFKIIERHGCNTLRIPSSFKILLMKYAPNLFNIYIKLNIFLGNKIPHFGSFYFLTLQK
jgi:ubiquinone/menaquinone biosynthesis C-methylase UbiE